jgi:hypothetical protein
MSTRRHSDAGEVAHMFSMKYADYPIRYRLLGTTTTLCSIVCLRGRRRLPFAVLRAYPGTPGVANHASSTVCF